MFYDNLKAVCDAQGLKVTPIVAECGGAKGSISNWKKGATPNSDIVVKLAVRLNVSTDTLLFGKERVSAINLQNSHIGTVGAVGQNINGTFNLGNDNVSYEYNSITEPNSIEEDNSTENDEMSEELLRIFKALPLKERTKIMTKVYEIEDECSKKK